MTPFDLFKSCGDARNHLALFGQHAGVRFFYSSFSSRCCCWSFRCVVSVSVSAFFVLWLLHVGFDLNRNQIGYQKDAEASKLGTLSACVRPRWRGACGVETWLWGPGKNQ